MNYSNWIRSALVRAVCLCSSVDDFNQQRIYIELSCLVNGYSYMFVESRVAHFYSCFHAETMRYSMDQTMYDKFRRQCFDFIDIHRTLSKKLQQSNDTGNMIHLNYLYEYGARCQFNKEFHKLWNRYFDSHPILSKEKITISLTTKHLHSLNALLSQQKSFCWLSL